MDLEHLGDVVRSNDVWTDIVLFTKDGKRQTISLPTRHAPWILAIIHTICYMVRRLTDLYSTYEPKSRSKLKPSNHYNYFLSERLKELAKGDGCRPDRFRTAISDYQQLTNEQKHKLKCKFRTIHFSERVNYQSVTFG
jgi:hypothetical protein